MIERIYSFVQKLSRQPPFALSIQSDETECGLASLVMVFRALGKECDLESLRRIYGSTRGGMTIGELCEFAATIGLRAIPSRIDASELSRTPSILFARNEHYSVLWNIEEKGEKTYCIADPSDGALYFSPKDFESYFSGVQITFRPIKKIFEGINLTQKTNNPPTISSLIVGKSVIIALICILASVSAVLALLNAAAQDVFMTYVVEEGEILWTKGLILITIILSLLVALSALMMQIAVQRQLQSVIQTWNINLFKSLFDAPFQFFISKPSGLITSRFNQVEEALSSYQSAVLSAFTGCLNLLVYVIAVMLVSPPLALVSAVGIGAFVYVGLKFYGYNIQNNYMIRDAECLAATAEFKLISGRDQIILEHADEAIKRDLTAGYTALGKSELSVARIGAINELFLGSIDQSLNALLLIVSSVLIVNGELTTGTYAAINVIIGTALEPIRSLSELMETFQNSRLTFQSAAELLPEQPEFVQHDLSPGKEKTSSKQDSVVKLEQVSYAYSKYSNPIISNSNLTLRTKSGKALAIRLDGKSGSGKSTFLNLLLGLITPTSGTVQICGIQVNGLPVNKLRKVVQYVDRTALITRGTVEWNTRLGTNASHEDYISILEILGLQEELIFKHQNSRILQDETSISTGQAVMISLARAALMKPKLILIDESLISVPQELHKKIVNGLLMININLIIVQHGDSPFISSLPTLSMSSLSKEKDQ